MAMIPSPLQSAALAAAVQPPLPVLSTAATIDHLEAAVRYTFQVQNSVFGQVATMADFSAAVLYQTDVAMAQSPLLNQWFGAPMPVFPNLLAPIQARLVAIENSIQGYQADLQAVRDEQAVLRVSIMNTRARAVNGRRPPHTTLSVIRKEIAGHPAGVFRVAGPFAIGAEPPVGLIPTTKDEIRALHQHAALDQAYWFYNDPILAKAAHTLSERQKILEEFLTE